MKSTNPKVDAFINRAKTWKEETEKMRAILLDCGLDEDLKWGKPCYAHEGKNIAIIQGFKEYFAVLFFKGYLLKDPEGVLVKTGENTHVGRQMRFKDAREISKMKPVLKRYIKEAVKVEESGAQPKPAAIRELKFPEEFQNKLDEMPALKTAFFALTPGRQRVYNMYFSQPKQSKTRESRIEKQVKQILKGKGLNE